MMNDKAPSVSGYSKEFLYFWPEMGDLVISYANQAKEKGEFFITQRRGVVRFCQKGTVIKH